MNCAFCIAQDDCQNANHTNGLPYIEGNSLIFITCLTPSDVSSFRIILETLYMYIDLSDSSMAGVSLAIFCDVLVFLAKLLFPQSDNMFSCN